MKMVDPMRIDAYLQRVKALPDAWPAAQTFLIGAHIAETASVQHANVVLAYLSLGGDKRQPTSELEYIRHELCTLADEIAGTLIKKERKGRNVG